MDNFDNLVAMKNKKAHTETDLAGVAKRIREKAGKSKSEAALELGVSKTSITNAEERPERSLTALRIRLIEKYAGKKVSGPFFFLE